MGNSWEYGPWEGEAWEGARDPWEQERLEQDLWECERGRSWREDGREWGRWGGGGEGWEEDEWRGRRLERGVQGGRRGRVLERSRSLPQRDLVEHSTHPHDHYWLRGPCSPPARRAHSSMAPSLPWPPPPSPPWQPSLPWPPPALRPTSGLSDYSAPELYTNNKVGRRRRRWDQELEELEQELALLQSPDLPTFSSRLPAQPTLKPCIKRAATPHTLDPWAAVAATPSAFHPFTSKEQGVPR